MVDKWESVMDSKKDPIAIQMNVTRAFSEGSGATWATSFPQDAKLDDIDEVSDKIMSALTRQEVWARISQLNNEIEMHSKQKAQVEFAVKSLEMKHGDFSKTNKDIVNGYQQSKEGLIRLDLLIDALDAEQDRLRKHLF